MKDYFPKVREAREALQSKALELYDMHCKLIDQAMDVGDLEVASKHLQWLSEHMPSHNGITMIDPSVDKAKGESGPKGPTINIGLSLGGVTKPHELPPAIEVTPLLIPKDAETISHE